MNKEEYRKDLKSPKWISKRNEIRERDGHQCVKCKSKEQLHVHHKYYILGKMPWEVPDKCLITLCQVCHNKEHEGRPISSFYKKPTKKKVKKKSNKTKKKVSNNLSKTDADLQKKYDEIRKKGKLPESTYKPLNYKSKGKKKK